MKKKLVVVLLSAAMMCSGIWRMWSKIRQLRQQQ